MGSHIGRMDDLGIKAGCKERALSGSEVDEAEPFDKVKGWLEFQSTRGGPELFKVTLCGSQALKKDVFGHLGFGDHLVVDGLIFDRSFKAFGGLETLVETFAEFVLMLNVTINLRDWTIKVN